MSLRIFFLPRFFYVAVCNRGRIGDTYRVPREKRGYETRRTVLCRCCNRECVFLVGNAICERARKEHFIPDNGDDRP